MPHGQYIHDKIPDNHTWVANIIILTFFVTVYLFYNFNNYIFYRLRMAHV